MKTKQIKNDWSVGRFGRGMRLLFIPHVNNEYRPHLIRWRGIVAVIFVVGMLQIFDYVNAVAMIENTPITTNELLKETNAERAKSHMGALSVDSRLSDAAYLKAKDMFQKQYWAHVAPDGTTPWKWFDEAGYRYSYAGENLAKNFTTSSMVIAAWMASSEHRGNILNGHYTQVGFATADGVLNGRPANIIVALYAAPWDGGAVSVHVAESDHAPGLVGLVGRFGVMVSSISFVVLISIALLFAAALVAVGAHLYRDKQSTAFRRSWRRHHGFMKAAGMMSLSIGLLFMYSGGQI